MIYRLFFLIGISATLYLQAHSQFGSEGTLYFSSKMLSNKGIKFLRKNFMYYRVLCPRTPLAKIVLHNVSKRGIRTCEHRRFLNTACITRNWTITKTQNGFTLIELSIVLVVIGLIIGGILTGSDLINVAAQRAQITQIQRYNTAVRTFQNKYGGIPGDLLASTASSFGLAATTAGGTGLGDGNGLIQDPLGTNTPVGEILLFWRQLSDAGLVDGGFGYDITVSTAQGPTYINQFNDFPTAKIGRASSIIVGSDSGLNYFGIIAFYANTGVSGGPPGTAAYFSIRIPAFTPLEAYNIDKKIDDGMPLTGSVQARGYGAGDIIAALNMGTNVADWTATATSAACIIGGSWPITNYSIVTYNQVSGAGGNNPNCALRFQLN